MSANDKVLLSREFPVYNAPTQRDSNGNYCKLSNDSVSLHVANMFKLLDKMNYFGNYIIQIKYNIICCPSIKPPYAGQAPYQDEIWMKGLVLFQNSGYTYGDICVLMAINSYAVGLGMITCTAGNSNSCKIAWTSLRD